MHPALLEELQKKLISYFKIKKNWEWSGFTLIELLVVIAIMGILTGGAIVAYNNFSKAQTVRRAALQVKSDLRESQNRAVSGLKHEKCREDSVNKDDGFGGDNIEDFILVGHFVTFDESATAGINKSYQSTQACEDNPAQAVLVREVFYPGSTEDIDLPGEVFILNVRLVDVDGINCASLPGGQLTINFKPLQGVIFHAGTNVAAPTNFGCVKAEITVTDTVTNYEIEVDSSGQIVERKL